MILAIALLAFTVSWLPVLGRSNSAALLHVLQFRFGPFRHSLRDCLMLGTVDVQNC